MAVANSLNITGQGTLYENSTGIFSELDASTSGRVLISQGTGVAPSFSGSDIVSPGASTDRAIATWNSTAGAALYNNATAKIDSTGRITRTAQPDFVANWGVQTNDVTGDGTVYTMIPNAALVNQGTPYNVSTGVFTAPITGTYLFKTMFTLSGLLVGHTSLIVKLTNTTTSVDYIICQCNPFAIGSSSPLVLDLSSCTIIPMAASDTAVFKVQVSGSTKTVDVFSQNTNSSFNNFSGFLIC